MRAPRFIAFAWPFGAVTLASLAGEFAVLHTEMEI
jgi:hypothetical protein